MAASCSFTQALADASDFSSYKGSEYPIARLSVLSRNLNLDPVSVDKAGSRSGNVTLPAKPNLSEYRVYYSLKKGPTVKAVWWKFDSINGGQSEVIPGDGTDPTQDINEFALEQPGAFVFWYIFPYDANIPPKLPLAAVPMPYESAWGFGCGNSPANKAQGKLSFQGGDYFVMLAVLVAAVIALYFLARKAAA